MQCNLANEYCGQYYDWLSSIFVTAFSLIQKPGLSKDVQFFSNCIEIYVTDSLTNSLITTSTKNLFIAAYICIFFFSSCTCLKSF